MIPKARDILDLEVTAMVGESYQRAYPSVVNVQMLSELEEVIAYKLVPERRPAIRQMWWQRLQGCQLQGVVLRLAVQQLPPQRGPRAGVPKQQKWLTRGLQKQ